VLCELAERADVVDVLRLRASMPFTAQLSAMDALRMLRDRGTGVVHLPPQLPQLIFDEELSWDTKPFGLSAAQCAALEPEASVRVCRCVADAVPCPHLPG
jgi:hypothetical protein